MEKHLACVQFFLDGGEVPADDLRESIKMLQWEAYVNESKLMIISGALKQDNTDHLNVMADYFSSPPTIEFELDPDLLT